MNGPTRLVTGYGIGGFAYFAGILISALLDLPTGAVTVWTMAVTSLLAGLVIGRWSARPAVSG
jgi:zinc/manganese transport system permease protein